MKNITHQSHATRRGNSLIELIVATMLVGVLLTAAMASVGQSLVSRRIMSQKSTWRADGSDIAE